MRNPVTTDHTWTFGKIGLAIDAVTKVADAVGRLCPLQNQGVDASWQSGDLWSRGTGFRCDGISEPEDS